MSEFSPGAETEAEQLAARLTRTLATLHPDMQRRHQCSARTQLIRIVHWLDEVDGDYTLAIVPRNSQSAEPPTRGDVLLELSRVAKAAGLTVRLELTSGEIRGESL